MPVDLSNTLVIGISSTALFDLAESDHVFQTRGMTAYRETMLKQENTLLRPGTAFPLVRSLLRLNSHTPAGAAPLTEVVVMSRNSPETGVCIMNSVRRHELGISRFAFTGGEPLAPYVEAFNLDLFLSTSAPDVQAVSDRGCCAAARLYPPPPGAKPPPVDQLRIAFDADAVLFGEESEIEYRRGGLSAFHQKEDAERDVPMHEGPFAAFLKKLALLQERLPDPVEYTDVRIAIVTARNAPAETRVITTLRAWNVYVDAAFFLGGLKKDRILEALRPHIFFDDQEVHTLSASALVPSGKVPHPAGSPLSDSSPAPDVLAEGPEDAVAVSRSPADVQRQGAREGSLHGSVQCEGECSSSISECTGGYSRDSS